MVAEDAMDLKIFGVHLVMELAPVLLAAQRMGHEVHNGGAAHLIGKGHLLRAQAGVPGVIDREPPMAHGGGGADIGCNAETQLLRLSVERPDMRVIMTPVLSHYRIVARRSAGIASLRDLAGKRVATFPRTSAAYYLFDELRRAGLAERDVTLVPAAPADEVTQTLLDGRSDAIAIWEPAGENALAALGSDGIAFRSPGAYRMLFGLNTTADKLADPAKRKQIVALVGAVSRACRDIAAAPEIVWPLSARTSGYPVDQVRACWQHHTFPGTLAADLLDWMVDQEQWVALEQDRAPRSRAALAVLIDPSVLEEARGG
jgi:sulfonate transport system substrate-binding protein